MAIARSTESGTWLLWSTSLLKNIWYYISWTKHRPMEIIILAIVTHRKSFIIFSFARPWPSDSLSFLECIDHDIKGKKSWKWCQDVKLMVMTRQKYEEDLRRFHHTILKMILIYGEKLINYRLLPVQFLISPTWVSQTCFESWHLRELEHLQKWKHFRIKTAEKAYLNLDIFCHRSKLKVFKTFRKLYLLSQASPSRERLPQLLSVKCKYPLCNQL